MPLHCFYYWHTATRMKNQTVDNDINLCPYALQVSMVLSNPGLNQDLTILNNSFFIHTTSMHFH
jgi:hypothetical protein